jgi:hypothetical protein
MSQPQAQAQSPALYLDIPDARREAAAAHVAMISATARKVALDLPLQADVDDFRRVLIASAPVARGSK